MWWGRGVGRAANRPLKIFHGAPECNSVSRFLARTVTTVTKFPSSPGSCLFPRRIPLRDSPHIPLLLLLLHYFLSSLLSVSREHRGDLPIRFPARVHPTSVRRVKKAFSGPERPYELGNFRNTPCTFTSCLVFRPVSLLTPSGRRVEPKLREEKRLGTNCRDSPLSSHDLYTETSLYCSWYYSRRWLGARVAPWVRVGTNGN